MTAERHALAPDSPLFNVHPNPAFVDEEITIRVTGLPPGVRAKIRASVRDDAGRVWESHGLFRAGADGCLDLASDESIRGTYRGQHAMGLFWSMRLAARPGSAQATFVKNGAAPDIVELKLEAGGRELASAHLGRRWLPPDATVREVREDGLIAQFFVPPGRGPHRAVMVLGGSGGGYDLDKAAALARHGFATLALAYFGIPPLPQWLHRVPLEYFGRALECLARQPEIDANHIGILGVSRGAELALLLGSHFPAIGPIVAYAPSSVAWGSGGRDKATGAIIPCWTWRGTPVPFAPLPLKRFIARSAVPVGLLRRPVEFRKLFRLAFLDRISIEQAMIPVEDCRGPILLISGGDDHVWPSAKMAGLIVQRLRSSGLARIVEHLNFPDAGHSLRYPYLPTTPRTYHSHGLKYPVSFGGTAPADATAQTDSWRHAIAFLCQHL